MTSGSGVTPLPLRKSALLLRGIASWAAAARAVPLPSFPFPIPFAGAFAGVPVESC